MEFTDSNTVVTTMYSLEYCIKLMASMIPLGFGLGFIPMIFGLGISGVMKILKRA